MKKTIERLANVGPGPILGVIAIVLAVTGTAVAGIPKGDPLKLGMFKQDSRDRLAGTGVIQYAKQTHNTGATDLTKPKDFTVNCELKKKATSGGFNWLGTPPAPATYQFLSAYPTGSGFKVRLYILAADAANKQIEVYSNCVKSRKQRGTPPL